MRRAWLPAAALTAAPGAGNPACWSEGFTYERCCAAPKSDCWDAVYTYASCCVAPAPPAPAAAPGLALQAASDAEPPPPRDPEVYRQDHARRSSSYLQSSKEWLARARHAQAQHTLSELERSVHGRADESSREPTALVLNSLLWGAVTELLAGVDLGGQADPTMWQQAANTMVEIARLGKDLTPSIFDPDALDAHTEALLLRACELVGCGSSVPRPVHDLGVPDVKLDLPQGHVFSSAEPELRPVYSNGTVGQPAEAVLENATRAFDMQALAIRQQLFPTEVWVVPLAEHLPVNFTSFLAATAMDMFHHFRADLEAREGPSVPLDSVNNAFFAWQPSSRDEQKEQSSKWPALYESTAFEQLRELVLQAGQAYLRARGDARADALDVAVWASVYLEEGTGIGYHDHPLSVLAGSFYVQVPPEGAPIAFADPRGVQLDYMEQVAADVAYEPKAPFQRPTYFEPVPGDVVLFPPWLLHRVPPITAGPRVTFACNFFTQEGSPLTAWSTRP